MWNDRSHELQQKSAVLAHLGLGFSWSPNSHPSHQSASRDLPEGSQGRHIWWSHHVMITYEDYIWWPYTMIICDHRALWSYVMIMNDNRTVCMVIIRDDHIWWSGMWSCTMTVSDMMTICGDQLQQPSMMIIYGRHLGHNGPGTCVCRGKHLWQNQFPYRTSEILIIGVQRSISNCSARTEIQLKRTEKKY